MNKVVRRLLALICTSVCCASCTSAPTHFAGDKLMMTPFSIGQSNLDPFLKKLFKNISEDYDLVISGKKPKNAVFDSEAALPSDGGTVYYKGKGYYLTVQRRAVEIQGISGYLYGPRFKIQRNLLTGDADEISAVHFYSSAEMLKLENTNE